MQQQKDLNKALNIGLISLIGCVIPIIGIILAVVSIVLAAQVTSNENTSGKKTATYVVATLGILLAIGASFAWYAAYKNHAHDAQLQTEQVQQAQSNQQSQQEASQTALDSCLQQADNNYWSYVKLNATGSKQTDQGTVYTMPQNYWDYADSKKKQDQDACYKRYPNASGTPSNTSSTIPVQQ